MTNSLKTAQNTSKLGAYLNSGLYKKTGIDWLIENLWFFLCGYINELAFTCLLNHLNSNSMENIMVVLLRLCRLIWNYAHLCSTLNLGTLLCESCFVSSIKSLVSIMSFPYWDFTSYLEVESERYGFSNADHQAVTWVNTKIVTFENIFRSSHIIMGIARKLQSVVISTSLIMYRSLLGLKTELNRYENEIWEVSRVITQNRYLLDQIRVLYELLWTSQHPLWH